MKTVAEQLVEQTMRELNMPVNVTASSRVWTDPTGYRFLVQWTNLVLLEILVRKFTSTLPKKEYRLVAQMNDAARSNIANLEEGWKRATTSDYLQFLSYTQGSLEEVSGDIRCSLQNNLLSSDPTSSLDTLGIDLESWKTYCANPTNSPKFLYFPLKDSKGILKELRGENLTYEIFHELINKTDYILRKLVISLETKLENEGKYYQVQKARIRGNLRFKK